MAARAAVEDLVKTIEHVELETLEDFLYFFTEGVLFSPIRPDGTAPA